LTLRKQAAWMRLAERRQAAAQVGQVGHYLDSQEAATLDGVVQRKCYGLPRYMLSARVVTTPKPTAVSAASFSAACWRISFRFQ